MKKFIANRYEEGKLIELVNSEDLEDLYNTIEADENFILNWTENEERRSAIVIAVTVSSKVRNGELELRAHERN